MSLLQGSLLLEASMACSILASWTSLSLDLIEPYFYISLCDNWINAFSPSAGEPHMGRDRISFVGTVFHLFCSPLYPQIRCMWEWAIVLSFSCSVASNSFVTLWIIACKAPQSTHKDGHRDRGDAGSVCQVTEVNDCHVLSITARACPHILIATLWDHIIPLFHRWENLGGGREQINSVF